MNKAEKFLQELENEKVLQTMQDLAGKNITISVTPGTTTDSGTIQRDGVVSSPSAVPSTMPPPDYRRKSRVIYIVLAFFLGGWGIHELYRGSRKWWLYPIFNIIGTIGLIGGIIYDDAKFLLPTLFGVWICLVIWYQIFTETKDSNGVLFR